MANAAPAVVTVTSTTGPGQSVTAQVFRDVVNVEVDFNRNVIKLTRSGSAGIQYFDFSAIATVTFTVSGGISTLAFS
jgi:hypothetical protein